MMNILFLNLQKIMSSDILNNATTFFLGNLVTNQLSTNNLYIPSINNTSNNIKMIKIISGDSSNPINIINMTNINNNIAQNSYITTTNSQNISCLTYYLYAFQSLMNSNLYYLFPSENLIANSNSALTYDSTTSSSNINSITIPFILNNNPYTLICNNNDMLFDVSSIDARNNEVYTASSTETNNYQILPAQGNMFITLNTSTGQFTFYTASASISTSNSIQYQLVNNNIEITENNDTIYRITPFSENINVSTSQSPQENDTLINIFQYITFEY